MRRGEAFRREKQHDGLVAKKSIATQAGSRELRAESGRRVNPQRITARLCVIVVPIVEMFSSLSTGVSTGREFIGWFHFATFTVARNTSTKRWRAFSSGIAHALRDPARRR